MLQRIPRTLVFLAFVTLPTLVSRAGTGAAQSAWSAQAPAVVPASDPLAGLERVDWSGWETLPQLLTDVQAKTGIPALAAAFVANGKTLASATVGVRSVDARDPVGATDRFHLGSVTKSFTAVVIGKLIEDGLLRFETTVAEVLPEVEMHAGYRAVTLEELLQHRGGLHAYTDARPAGASDSTFGPGTPTEMRARFLADALRIAPARAGTAAERGMLYSNAGFALAGHMAEIVTDTSWEELVRTIVFEPLGMTSAGFGVPTQPSGHVFRDGRFSAVPLAAYPAMDIVAPAGNVHCSVDDLARYALAHLAGLSGKDGPPGFPRAETLRRLHGLQPGADTALSYAGGWMLRRTTQDGPVHWHGGTIGASYAEVRLFPASGSAALVLTSVEQALGEVLANRLQRAMRERWGGPSVAPGGFVARDARATEVEVIEVEAKAGEDAACWSAALRLARALNDEDRSAYHALFTARQSRADLDSMFDFMAENVIPARGGIRWFHELSKPRHIGGDEQTMRIATFHLENGFPGYLGLTLTEAGLIDQLSLFVTSEVCPSGPDPDCKAIVRDLDEEDE